MFPILPEGTEIKFYHLTGMFVGLATEILTLRLNFTLIVDNC